MYFPLMSWGFDLPLFCYQLLFVILLDDLANHLDSPAVFYLWKLIFEPPTEYSAGNCQVEARLDDGQEALLLLLLINVPGWAN